MPTINGVNFQYNGGVGDEEVRRSAQATVTLRNAVDEALYQNNRTGTWESASRLPGGGVIGRATE